MAPARKLPQLKSRWNMFRKILNRLPRITRTKSIPQSALAFPTTTNESDYEFQHRRDSIGLGHNNRTGVEL